MKYYACMYPNGYFVAKETYQSSYPYETDNPNRMTFWFDRQRAEEYVTKFADLRLRLKVVEINLTITPTD